MPVRFLVVVALLMQALTACTNTRTVRMSPGHYQLHLDSPPGEGVTVNVDLEAMSLEVESLGIRSSATLSNLAKSAWGGGCRAGTNVAEEETFSIVPPVAIMHFTYDRVAADCRDGGLKFWSEAPGGGSLLYLLNANTPKMREN